MQEYRVVSTPDPALPHAVVGPDGMLVESVAAYLRELTAGDSSPLTIRSYAFDLLDWFRFVDGCGVRWDLVERVHVRDYVLRLRSAENPQRRGVAGGPAAGSTNPRTGKRYRRPGYAPATINHRLAVLSGFYEFWLHSDAGVAVNPVPTGGTGGSRRGQHHNPMEPWRPPRRAGYRQKTEQLVPRAIPDNLYNESFASLTSDRDRAIVSVLVSSGARASELLGMTGADVDWGGQRVRLIGKGSREAQWVAVSPEALRWLGGYLAGERPPLERGDPLWLTLRRPFRPLAYQALRAMLLRVNTKLGTNLVLHDFRHTCGLRLASDPTIPVTDVSAHLRHRHLASSEPYLVAPPEDVIARVQEHHRAAAAAGAERPTASNAASNVSWDYDQADLDLLLGPEAS